MRRGKSLWHERALGFAVPPRHAEPVRAGELHVYPEHGLTPHSVMRKTSSTRPTRTRARGRRDRTPQRVDRHGYVDLKLVSADATHRDDEGTEYVLDWVTQQDVDLARRISEIAADHTSAGRSGSAVAARRSSRPPRPGPLAASCESGVNGPSIPRGRRPATDPTSRNSTAG